MKKPLLTRSPVLSPLVLLSLLLGLATAVTPCRDLHLSLSAHPGAGMCSHHGGALGGRR